jgi:dihydroorotate dehydrogenase (fumarate)
MILEPLVIDPPLLNSATPWATTMEDLTSLYNSPHTGAITIRPSLLNGFAHDPSIHQYTFFSPAAACSSSPISADDGRGSSALSTETSSLNTLGYSPIPLREYLAWLGAAATGAVPNFTPRPAKPIIVSVTGSAGEIAQCYALIAQTQAAHHDLTLMMEINLSCPNIPDKPPPAYDGSALAAYLAALSWAALESPDPVVYVGIKTPPYTYQGQFRTLIEALEAGAAAAGAAESKECPIQFITANNTLGSCLVMNLDGAASLSSATGDGIGGMAGPNLHPLALGNVLTIRRMLDASGAASVRKISIIGVGGVSDAEGFARMRSVGAMAVGVGTALGRQGVDVFNKIAAGK